MSVDEIRAMNRARGIEPEDRTIAAVRAKLLRRALHELDLSLRERFLERSGLSDEERERLEARLVIVHDGLPLGWLAEVFLPQIDDAFHAEAAAEASGLHDEWLDGRAKESSPAWQELPSRQAFAAFNGGLGECDRYVKLGELDRPVPADVYAAPGPDLS
jgi:hypothetical protein